MYQPRAIIEIESIFVKLPVLIQVFYNLMIIMDLSVHGFETGEAPLNAPWEAYLNSETPRGILCVCVGAWMR